MSTTPAKPTYTERMDKTGRPVSPHLMIYRLPLIAWSSVTVRITGVVGSGLAIVIAGTTLVGGGECASDIVESGVAAFPMLVMPAKFAIAWPLTYHAREHAPHVLGPDSQGLQQHYDASHLVRHRRSDDCDQCRLGPVYYAGSEQGVQEVTQSHGPWRAIS